MTLQELGYEYLRSAQAVRKRIVQLKNGLDEREKLQNRELKSRIYSLYCSARDAETTGNYLVHYKEGVLLQ